MFGLDSVQLWYFAQKYGFLAKYAGITTSIPGSIYL